MLVMVDIESNLRDLERRIAEAADRVRRDPAEITLVAVTKMFTVAHIQAAYELGLRHFGENRVGEAAEKIPIVNQWIEEHALPPIKWHMVGHLQSRKARDAIQLFDIVQLVDTLKLASRLDRLCGHEGKAMPIAIKPPSKAPQVSCSWAIPPENGMTAFWKSSMVSSSASSKYRINTTIQQRAQP